MVDSCESRMVITITFPEQRSVYSEDNSVNVEEKQKNCVETVGDL